MKIEFEKVRFLEMNIFSRTSAERLAAKQLRVFIDIINETVGDAIADLLATEAILATMNLTIQGWLDLYKDLPQRQLKVAVKDRTLIQTTDAERRVVAPAHLQDCIDELVSKYPSGRSFVRYENESQFNLKTHLFCFFLLFKTIRY